MKQLIYFAVVFFCCANFQTGVWVNAINVVLYLSRFGYLPPEYKNSERANLITDEFLKSALEDYQSFYGLNVTGVVDDETLKLMNTPRCGVPDKIWTNSESENYVLSRSSFRWNTTYITYQMTNYSSNTNLTRSYIDQTIVKVSKLWTSYALLTVERTYGANVDIYIGFAVGNHGDKTIFDGPGNTLGHAFYPGPGLGGDIHFDDQEYWTVGIGAEGTFRFERVCTHEFGHALGLNHSKQEGVIMYAYEPYDTTPLHLRADDIAGIQAIYGARVKVKPPQGPTPTPGYGYRICNISLYDYTIFTDYDFKTYFLSGSYFWQITNKGIISQHSQMISSKWQNVVGTVDAAFVYKGITYLFTNDSMCYAYKYSKLIAGYPMTIASRFKGFPNSVDSVLVYGTKVYAFKGYHCWGYPVRRWDKGYPQGITAMWGSNVPTEITAAVTYRNGRHYFFKDNYYWRYNEITLNIDYVRRNPYPRSMKSLWLRCD